MVVARPIIPTAFKLHHLAQFIVIYMRISYCLWVACAVYMSVLSIWYLTHYNWAYHCIAVNNDYLEVFEESIIMMLQAKGKA